MYEDYKAIEISSTPSRQNNSSLEIFSVIYNDGDEFSKEILIFRHGFGIKKSRIESAAKQYLDSVCAKYKGVQFVSLKTIYFKQRQFLNAALIGGLASIQVQIILIYQVKTIKSLEEVRLQISLPEIVQTTVLEFLVDKANDRNELFKEKCKALFENLYCLETKQALLYCCHTYPFSTRKGESKEQFNERNGFGLRISSPTLTTSSMSLLPNFSLQRDTSQSSLSSSNSFSSTSPIISRQQMVPPLNMAGLGQPAPVVPPLSTRIPPPIPSTPRPVRLNAVPSSPPPLHMPSLAPVAIQPFQVTSFSPVETPQLPISLESLNLIPTSKLPAPLATPRRRPTLGALLGSNHPNPLDR